jgi:hypothetical protein
MLMWIESISIITVLSERPYSLVFFDVRLWSWSVVFFKGPLYAKNMVNKDSGEVNSFII